MLKREADGKWKFSLNLKPGEFDFLGVVAVGPRDPEMTRKKALNLAVTEFLTSLKEVSDDDFEQTPEGLTFSFSEEEAKSIKERASELEKDASKVVVKEGFFLEYIKKHLRSASALDPRKLELLPRPADSGSASKDKGPDGSPTSHASQKLSHRVHGGGRASTDA